MFFNIIVSVLALGGMCLALFNIVKLLHAIKMIEQIKQIIEGESFDEEEESVISEHVTERERLFDERIASLSKELGIQKGHTAEILHPDVENLPHDSVKAVNYEPLEEYAK